MIKKQDAKTIIEKLKKPQRKPELVTYRIDKSVKSEFTRACEQNGVSAALVVEELMQCFVEETKKK